MFFSGKHLHPSLIPASKVITIPKCVPYIGLAMCVPQVDKILGFLSKRKTLSNDGYAIEFIILSPGACSVKLFIAATVVI